MKILNMTKILSMTMMTSLISMQAFAMEARELLSFAETKPRHSIELDKTVVAESEDSYRGPYSNQQQHNVHQDPAIDLLRAVEQRDFSMLKSALRVEKNLEVQDKNQCTPLHRAAAHEEENMVELLLFYGARIDAKEASGYTVLECAAIRGSVPVVEKILEHIDRLEAFKDADFTIAKEKALEQATRMKHKPMKTLLETYARKK